MSRNRPVGVGAGEALGRLLADEAVVQQRGRRVQAVRADEPAQSARAPTSGPSSAGSSGRPRAAPATADGPDVA